MRIFKAFSRRNAPAPKEVTVVNQSKIEARLGQITKSVCRRGMDGSINCSPYTPCFDICPVITTPSESKIANPDHSVSQGTAIKTREEVIKAVRLAGVRNSRVELMRIVAQQPLDFASAMEAFRDGVKASSNESEHSRDLAIMDE
jgi:hypothetical protein